MTVPTGKRWLIASADDSRVARLARTLSVPVPLAQVLVNRGYPDPESARRFLNPRLANLSDPYALPDMTPAVERLLLAVARHEPVVIYGDYDVDGLTATALLTRVFAAAGLTVSPFLPHRVDEGYGLSADGLSRCLTDHQPKLLVAVDCGTTAVREIDHLRQNGVDVIVVDHHEPGPELPCCAAVVNPKRGTAAGVSGSAGASPSHERQRSGLRESEAPAEPCPGLASVGVAFKLAHALQKRGRDLGQPWAAQFDLRDYLDLVAVGTVADLVPLTGDNRILTRAGLERLAATRSAGLRALQQVAAVPARVTPYHIGFRIGPRLNAAGRLADATVALELLLTDDPTRAAVLAEQLDRHNAERQRIEQRILAAARGAVARDWDPARDRVLVLAGQDWHLGVVGIVAARLVQEHYRPAVVLGIEGDEGRGSCRSIPGFSIVEALAACADLLEAHGGHAMAAGLTVKTGRIDELRRRLNAQAAAVLAEEDLQPAVRIDATVSLCEIDEAFVRAAERFEPCGPSNPAPVFAVQNVAGRGRPRRLGKDHLRFTVSDGAASCPAVWWGGAAQGLPRGPMDVAFVAELDDYWGEPVVQLKVRDVREAE
ncbi:DHH family phosphoesterase [bacterium]|nr:DHH family phosphoesterase [bacterium]